MTNVIEFPRAPKGRTNLDKDGRPCLPFHFYAVCMFGWATAPTGELAIAKLKAAFEHSFVDEVPATYWLALVPLPADASYGISCYKPEVPDVEWLEEGDLRKWNVEDHFG